MPCPLTSSPAAHALNCRRAQRPGHTQTRPTLQRTRAIRVRTRPFPGQRAASRAVKLAAGRTQTRGTRERKVETSYTWSSPLQSACSSSFTCRTISKHSAPLYTRARTCEVSHSRRPINYARAQRATVCACVHAVPGESAWPRATNTASCGGGGGGGTSAAAAGHDAR
jgi:hypothetical protein